MILCSTSSAAFEISMQLNSRPGPQGLRQPHEPSTSYAAPSSGSHRALNHLHRDVRMRHRSHEWSLWRGETPVPKNYMPTVVPGARTASTPLLSPEKVAERLKTSVYGEMAHHRAFYSSELGGIITDPAFMVIHMDDHMVHRGHGVFDTALLTDGYLYQLPRHMARFKRSAELAGLKLFRSEDALMRIVLDVAAASRHLNGIVKFWATAGRGGYGLSTRECPEPGFYAICTSENIVKGDQLDRTAGFRGCVSPVPPHGHPFATVKSNNYLRNALSLQDAESRGYDVGIFVDEKGFVQEGPNMNIGIITQDDVFVTPPFDGCLAGVTMQRLMELIPDEAKRSPNDVVVRDIQQRPITVDDVLAAKEAFLTGSTLRCMPLVSLDDKPIADGTSGITALAFDAMLVQDMQPGEKGGPEHIAVPYGFMTGMREQLR